MGWIILAVLFLLLLLPFLFPVRIVVRLDDSTRDWALFYGLFQFAPDTERRLGELLKRLVRHSRTPLRILKWICLGLLLPFQLLRLLYKAVRWPIHHVSANRRRFLRERTQQQRARSSEPERSVPSPAPPEDSAPQSSDPESEGEARRVPGPPTNRAMDQPDGDSSANDTPGEPAEADSPWEMDEETAKTTPPRPDESAVSDGDGGDEEGSVGIAGRVRAAFSGAASIKSKLDEMLGYYHQYGPLAKKILRRFFRFVSRCRRAFTFRRFDARFTMGGDPATLGALLGWHHALGASIHPSIPRHLVFEPNYDSEELSPHGTLDFELVIWPYRFLLPTLTLIVTMPWLSIYRVVRKRGKLDSA